jgi:hypothetical protein
LGHARGDGEELLLVPDRFERFQGVAFERAVPEPEDVAGVADDRGAVAGEGVVDLRDAARGTTGAPLRPSRAWRSKTE